MERIEVILDEKNIGEIQLFSDDKKAGKMDISISRDLLRVFHTEVDEEHNGKGFAKLLLNKLVSYAREHSLKIIPLCPFVHAQFKRRPEEFQDVWYKKLHS
ncbi:N-acetyltransferase [Sphingobacterium sp. lm-10]|uniref:GNAT family N-acetyltransferase n=1 Tax=Sphingobacterium sp. lm-10 TaxID=2944904 RepID=UPI002022855A|nr:GNAT family N-acetyltransferase [Sphingobacterium sp. lm-10]MCL7988294.1 N-acetyltransferase [Sphingobacterium sp. lm-10]